MPLPLLVVLLLGLAGMAGAGEAITAFTDDHGVLAVADGGGDLVDVTPLAFGPNWAWSGIGGKTSEEQGAAVSRLGTRLGTGVVVNLELRTTVDDAGAVRIAAAVAATKETDLTMMCFVVAPGARFAGKARCRAETSAGAKILDVPFAKDTPGTNDAVGDGVTALTYTDATGAAVRVAFDRPVDISSDGTAHVALATRHLAANERHELGMTITLPPGSITRYADKDALPDDPAFARAFPWQPKQDDDAPSAISLADWLDAPAGRHGRVQRRGDQLLVDGEPAKFWGINNCYAACSPPKELADRRAALYAKYGINAVRLHKYADGTGGMGIQSKGSFAEFDPDALDRMDYFVAKLKERGIYVELSANFGVALGPDDLAAVPYAEEFGKLGAGQRVKPAGGSIFVCRELQDLEIRQAIAILAHRNPYTGLTYAEEPAVLAYELYNENDALWYGTMTAIQRYPTVRRLASAAFTDWLARRYGDERGLLTAWGDKALNSLEYEHLTGESFADKTIVPAGAPWYWDPDQLAGSQKYRRVRLLDTMHFLYDLQNGFWKRYSEALRAAGYQGEILASNWQAGRAMSHYANLASDREIGLIDRHNYYGGAGSMLSRAGSTLLSTGMQQAADRPFMVSEWLEMNHEWWPEGPALIGAYGLGLQGWDAAFIFENGDDGRFVTRLDGGLISPTLFGVFPAVARQVLRGDVRQSTLEAPRYVHLESLFEGKLGFVDRVTQAGDDKMMDSDVVSSRTLAVARCPVVFTDIERDTPAFDLSPFTRDGALVASTGQLRWTEATADHGGYIVIDTAATKAVVGFAEGRTVALGDVAITPRNRFAAIYLTAEGRGEDLRSARRLLLVAIGRARNAGTKSVGTHQVGSSAAPIMMEPVVADIALALPGKPTVRICDQDGCRTERTLPISDGRFTIDGGDSRTIYYEIDYGP